MSNNLKSMTKIRQILRSYAQGKGTKSISSRLGVARNTVKKYLRDFHHLSISYKDALSLQRAVFRTRLQPP